MTPHRSGLKDANAWDAVPKERSWFDAGSQFDRWRCPESMLDKDRVFAVAGRCVFVGKERLSDIKISPLQLLMEYLQKSQRRAKGEYAGTVIPTSALFKITPDSRVA